MTNEDEIKEHLISSDPNFRRLVEEHRSYESQLRSLSGRGLVTNQEQVQEVDIKKRKLFLKDQMSRRIQEYLLHEAGG
jgi:uncharacterized protein YdcH (DUF465 family)